MQSESLLTCHHFPRELIDLTDHTTPQRSAAVHAYRDLTQVKLWHDVTAQSCQQLVYLIAKEHAEDENVCIVPMSAQEPLPLSKIDDLFKTLPVKTSQAEPRVNCRIIMALVDTDTTVVYYNLYSGIQAPTKDSLSRKHR